MSVIRRILPTCKEMTRLLSDAMDRTLPWHVRLRIRIHLLMCTLCERYKRQLLFIRDLLRKHGDRLDDVSGSHEASLSPEAKERLRRALRAPPK